MTTTSDLVGFVAAALTGATDAGSRVYTPGDWPTWDQQCPVLLVRAVAERKVSQGRADVQFVVTAHVQVVARVAALAAAADGGGQVAEVALWTMQRQTEVAVINSPDLTGQLQQYAEVNSKLGFSSEGEEHYAELVMDMALEFYQGPEDFCEPAATALNEVQVSTELPSPVRPSGLMDGPKLDITFPS